jgi:hypothetical protein
MYPKPTGTPKPFNCLDYYDKLAEQMSRKMHEKASEDEKKRL